MEKALRSTMLMEELHNLVTNQLSLRSFFKTNIDSQLVAVLNGDRTFFQPPFSISSEDDKMSPRRVNERIQ